MKRILLLLSALCLLVGCGAQDTQTPTDAAPAASIPDDELFSDRDYEVGYSDAIPITLSGESASCSADSVEISGSTVTITGEGTYLLSGTLENGMVIVDASKSDKLQLVLDGVSIHSDTSAALYVRKADKVFLTTTADSQNTLSSGEEFVAIDDNSIDATIFSKADLTLNGQGTLTIDAPAGHGVVSKDDLVVTSGAYTVTAARHGLCGKDSVRIAGGVFEITAEKDGIHSKNEDDSALGFVVLRDGSYTITATGDGISASGAMQVEGGEYHILTGGGSDTVTLSSSGTWSWNPFDSQTSDSDDSVSAKGLKSGGAFTILGGSFTIDSADDALHSNASLTVENGSFTLSTGDDGMHADELLKILDGSIAISKSYEGLEGLQIEISGGDITLTASDDGLNAAGGSDGSGFGGFGGFGGNGGTDPDADSDCYIRISGGSLRIDASGDGIDSNGYLEISGGETYISGPSGSADGALDYGIDASITGGILVAGGSVGMAQNFGSSSTQGAMLVSVGSQTAGSSVTLADSSGNVLLQWTAEKAFECLNLSCPELTQGETYIITIGETSTEVTLSELIYSNVSGGFGGNGGMGRPGGMGNPNGMEKPDGTGEVDPPELPDGMTPPDGAELPDGMTPPDGAQMPDRMPNGMGGFDGNGGFGGNDGNAPEKPTEPGGADSGQLT